MMDLTPQMNAEAASASGGATAALSRAGALLRRRRLEALVLATVLLCCAYFFQGGGWNQNAHFATTVALVEHQELSLVRYRRSTGDLARTPLGVASVKAIGTALASAPGYVVARVVTAPISNHGNRVIARAYVTSVLSAGLALALFAAVLLATLRRRLGPTDALWVTLASVLATPLFPNSTMVNSTPFVALFALGSYSLLEGMRLRAVSPGPRALLAAGLLAGLPATFEYMTAVVVLPLGLYASWQLRRRRRIVWFALGCMLAAMVPLAHHAVLYGNPLHVGYASFARAGMAASAARGFFGFDGPSPARLVDLLVGPARGFLLLSPFLAAAIPGLARLLWHRGTRPEGVVTGAIAWSVLLLVASLAYWHSGWGLGSRYAYLFIVFSAMPVAAVFQRHRRLVGAGMAAGFAVMLAAAAVTATPPPPGHRGGVTVADFLLGRLFAGEVAMRHEAVLHEIGLGDGAPTWRTSFNLGQALGLEGAMSLLPLGMLLAVLGLALWRVAGAQQRGIAGAPSRADAAA